MNQLTSNDDALTKRLNDIILANLENENFGATELAKLAGISSFKLNCKLRLIARKTLNPYIREVRLQRAMEMLQSKSGTASEIGFKVGFNSPAYFSTCFSEYFGYPPGEVMKRDIDGHGENGGGFSEEQITIEQESGTSVTRPTLWKNKFRKRASMVSLSILFIIAFMYFINREIFGNLIFSTDGQSKNQDKSIAVLPFINDSKDQDNVYFINGVLEALLDNLSRIEELEVRPRTSVEKYRNNGTKTIPQIARELGVNYILEGSGQKIGDQVSLYIQLIEASSDKHLFSNRYDMKLENIFNLQSEVAIKVASEIKAIISTEEEKPTEKTPVANIEARNLFLQANDLHNVAESEKKLELKIKAEGLYKRAIRLDSTYADPYTSLGWIVYDRDPDSALYLANKTLHFDPKNPEAYTLKGFILRNKGMNKEAEEDFRQSIRYKPNNSSAFRYLGEMYFDQGDCSRAIESQLQAFQMNNNLMQELNIVESLCSSLYYLGFYKEGEKYAAKLLELNNDSSCYYWVLATADLDLGNYKSALKSARKMYSFDTNDPNNIYLLMYTYLYLRDFKEADLLIKKYEGIINQQGRKIEPDYLLGFIYLENGQKEEANFHFNGIIKEMSDYIKLGQPSITCVACMTLAKIYSALGEKEKALEYLMKVEDNIGYTIFRVKDFKNCTMLDNIRHEPGFAEYLKDVEARFKKEHDKVAKLLHQEGMLSSLY